MDWHTIFIYGGVLAAALIAAALAIPLLQHVRRPDPTIAQLDDMLRRSVQIESALKEDEMRFLLGDPRGHVEYFRATERGTLREELYVYPSGAKGIFFKFVGGHLSTARWGRLNYEPGPRLAPEEHRAVFGLLERVRSAANAFLARQK